MVFVTPEDYQNGYLFKGEEDLAQGAGQDKEAGLEVGHRVGVPQLCFPSWTMVYQLVLNLFQRSMT